MHSEIGDSENEKNNQKHSGERIGSSFADCQSPFVGIRTPIVQWLSPPVDTGVRLQL